MTSPVFFLEILHAGRRGRVHRARWAYGGWLALELAIFCYLYAFETSLIFPWQTPDLAKVAVLIQSVYFLIVLQHFLVMTVGAATLSAGSVTDDKVAGTLQDLLTTRVSAWDIIIGKWLGRVAQLFVFSLAVTPVLCLLSYFAGWGPLPAAIVLVSSLFPAAGIAAAGVLTSVWSRRTPTAVLSTLVLGTLITVPLYIAGTNSFNPVFILEATWAGKSFWEIDWHVLAGGAGWATFSLLCLLVAAWRLRPAYRRQLEAATPRSWLGRQWLERPPVSDLPIRWKERYVGEMRSLPGLWVTPRRVRILAIVALTVGSSSAILAAHLPSQCGPADWLRACVQLDYVAVARSTAGIRPAGNAFLLQGVSALIIGSLWVGVRAAVSVTAERERQTWEGLLLTPLDAKQVIRGKVWGIIDSARPYLLAYILPAVAFSAVGGFAAIYWTSFWWLLTWMVMYFIAGAGVEASVRSSSSWRSLLNTLVTAGKAALSRLVLIGMGCGFVIAAAVSLLSPSTPTGAPSGLSIVVFISVACATTAIALFAQGEFLIMRAEALVAFYERVSQSKPAILIKEKRNKHRLERLPGSQFD